MLAKDVEEGCRMTDRIYFAALFALCICGCTGGGVSGPQVEAAGASETIKTNILEAGATALQNDAPPDGLDIYLVGFHPMKANPLHQMEAHHFCKQVNEDFAQCTIFDGNTADANLNGIEYIISERLFERLPGAEKQYWHPHNGEILSGQLVSPGLPDMAGHELMRSKMNSYGKTWHVWHTGYYGMRGDELPLGEPMLAWSFNRESEAVPGLVEERDRRMNINSAELRQRRQDLLPVAHRQSGVDALKGKFGRPTRPIPGVVDENAARPIPTNMTAIESSRPSQPASVTSPKPSSRAPSR
jgi:hypothetical protein